MIFLNFLIIAVTNYSQYDALYNESLHKLLITYIFIILQLVQINFENMNMKI